MAHPAVPTLIFGSLCLLDAALVYACHPEAPVDGLMPDTLADLEDEDEEEEEGD